MTTRRRPLRTFAESVVVEDMWTEPSAQSRSLGTTAMEETVARESRPVRAQNGSSSVRVLGVWWKTVSVTVGLRVARPEDASTLREIERRAGEQFRRINDIADHEPPSVETLVGYANARRCWV